MKHDQANNSMRETVKAFIKQELSYGLDDFNPEADLIEQGVVDSMSLLRLISFLEEHFQIEVRDEDLVPDNFRSLAAIETFVQRSRNAQAGQ